ncbi:hypothetical protein DFH09DRAFT_462243 [Mycena vulgaris]|nr:hypothetical protein DFH09DRAFT_462243 [Mycena vulgaris]
MSANDCCGMLISCCMCCCTSSATPLVIALTNEVSFVPKLCAATAATVHVFGGSSAYSRTPGAESSMTHTPRMRRWRSAIVRQLYSKAKTTPSLRLSLGWIPNLEDRISGTSRISFDDKSVLHVYLNFCEACCILSITDHLICIPPMASPSV